MDIQVVERVQRVDTAPVTTAEVAAPVRPVEVPEHYILASPGTRSAARQALQQSMDSRW